MDGGLALHKHVDRLHREFIGIVASALKTATLRALKHAANKHC